MAPGSGLGHWRLVLLSRADRTPAESWGWGAGAQVIRVWCWCHAYGLSQSRRQSYDVVGQALAESGLEPWWAGASGR